MLAVINCSQLVTLAGAARPRVGALMRELAIIEDGAMLVQGGVIEKVGARREIEPLIDAGCEVIDAGGRVVLPDGLGWQNARGNVLGVYLHGLFEDAAVLQALFGVVAPSLEAVFDGLADFIDRHFEAGVLPGLIAC